MAEIRINATGELKLYDSDDSNYVSFKSAGTVSSNVAWVLPSADGSSGQALTTNGSGTLSWATASSADPSSADGDSLGTASAEWSDLYLADGGIVYLGNDQDIRLTHNADKGLIIKHSATADDKPVILTLQTGETDIAQDDVLGKIEFQAPDEGTGTDAILVAAAIQAVSEGDFSSSSNATSLQFMTGSSEAAAEKMTLTSAGILNAGKIGVVGDHDLGVGLHIKTGDSSATPIASADELVVEGSASAGISILTGNDDNGYLCFGDDGDADIGNINYRHDTNMMRFNTNGTERLQIANNGDIHIPGTAGDGYMTIKGGSTEAYVVHNGTAAGNTTLYMFKVGGNEVGTINRTSSGTSYNTSSDYRLKENETAITDGITRVKQLKPYKFNFKVDKDKTVDGFFAHEVSGIVPEAISGEKDGENMQGIDQSKLVPLLTGALQEAITKIETLETKVAALEG